MNLNKLKSPISNRLTELVNSSNDLPSALLQIVELEIQIQWIKSIKSKVIDHNLITKNNGQVLELLFFQLINQSTHTTYPSVPCNLSTVILERKLTSCTYFAGFVGIQPWKRPCTFCSPVIRMGHTKYYFWKAAAINSGRLGLNAFYFSSQRKREYFSMKNRHFLKSFVQIFVPYISTYLLSISFQRFSLSQKRKRRLRKRNILW